MDTKLKQFLDNAFAPYGDFPARQDVTQELLTNLIERYNDLKAAGKSDSEAFRLTTESLGDIAEIMEHVPHNTAEAANSAVIKEPGVGKTIVRCPWPPSWPTWPRVFVSSIYASYTPIGYTYRRYVVKLSFAFPAIYDIFPTKAPALLCRAAPLLVCFDVSLHQSLRANRQSQQSLPVPVQRTSAWLQTYT